MAVAVASRRGEPLTGRQKVAILLMTVGEEASGEITKNLAPDEVEAISLEIARMGPVDPAVMESVLLEWRNTEQATAAIASGGVDYARRILDRALGPAKAAQVVKRIEARLADPGSLAALRAAEPQRLITILKGEHPQTMAVVLSLLEPGQTAGVLRELDQDLGGDVLVRMARLEKLHPEALRALEAALGSGEDAPETTEARAAGGPDAVAELLNLVPAAVEKGLLQAVAGADPQLSESIRNLMFVFEDIGRLDARAMPAIIREVESRELALSLRVASEELKQLVLGSMSSRARDALLEEMEFMGPVKVSDVQKAQANVVRAVRSLADKGEISLGSGGDDELV